MFVVLFEDDLYWFPLALFVVRASQEALGTACDPTDARADVVRGKPEEEDESIFSLIIDKNADILWSCPGREIAPSNEDGALTRCGLGSEWIITPLVSSRAVLAKRGLIVVPGAYRFPITNCSSGRRRGHRNSLSDEPPTSSLH